MPQRAALLPHRAASQTFGIAHQSLPEFKDVHTTEKASRPAELDPFLRLPFVELATGIKKSTIYLLMKRGEFPRSVQITPRCVAWRKSRITQWLEDTQAAADKAAAQAADEAAVAPPLPLPEGGAR